MYSTVLMYCIRAQYSYSMCARARVPHRALKYAREEHVCGDRFARLRSESRVGFYTYRGEEWRCRGKERRGGESDRLGSARPRDWLAVAAHLIALLCIASAAMIKRAGEQSTQT